MVLDRVVQQGGTDHVGIGDVVVAADPDGHPQQVINVGLALPPVSGMQPGGEGQRPARALLIALVQAGYLDGEPVPQPGFAVPGRDRVQRHRRQQPPFTRVHG